MAESSSLDEIILHHRQEKKELLALTQKMKHGIPKGDKKKKKEVTAEIAVMLSNLDMRHEKELKIFEENYSEDASSTSVQEDKRINLPDLYASGDFENNLDGKSPNITQKMSKAQKKRNKKAQQEKEREKAIAEQEIQNFSGARFLESAGITKQLSQRQLVIFEVPSDGNCLYKAIEHQLSTLNLEIKTVETLRDLTSKYLLSHKEDYLPFLANPSTGDILSDDQYVKYCEDIKNTSAWGGHIEIQALARICGKPIEVIQADGPSVISGNEGVGPKLIISYHRHAYGLGAHYNSTIPNI